MENPGLLCMNYGKCFADCLFQIFVEIRLVNKIQMLCLVYRTDIIQILADLDDLKAGTGLCGIFSCPDTGLFAKFNIHESKVKRFRGDFK